MNRTEIEPRKRNWKTKKQQQTRERPSSHRRVTHTRTYIQRKVERSRGGVNRYPKLVIVSDFVDWFSASRERERDVGFLSDLAATNPRISCFHAPLLRRTGDSSVRSYHRWIHLVLLCLRYHPRSCRHLDGKQCDSDRIGFYEITIFAW